MTQTIAPAPPKTTRRLGSSITARKNPPFWWAAIQLAGLASHLPLILLTGSLSAIASTESLAVVAVAVSAAAIALYLLLAWKLMPGWKALALVSVVVIVFWYWNGGRGVGVFTGPLAAIAVYLLVGAAAVKYAERHLFKVLAFVVTASLTGSLALLALADYLSAPERSVGVQDPVELQALTSRPDVILIVLDGYGRSDVIREFYGYDNEPFLNGLRAQGFQVAERSVANYSITHLALPALFNMSYMHADGASLGNNDMSYLATQVSDENAVVSFFKENGYSYIHGESDRWSNVCGKAADVCLSAPDPDITGHALLTRTPFGGLLYRTEDNPSTALNLRRIEELTNWDRTSEGWPTGPKFVFLHLELPHPPLFLDSTCGVRLDPELGGHNVRIRGSTEGQLAHRKAAWVEQLKCANAAVSKLVTQIDPETIVAVVSDHGPDGTFAPEPNRSDIDLDGLDERFPSLTAVRLPEECSGDLPDDTATVNVFRVIISCMTGDSIPLLETRTFVAGFGGPIFEFDLVPARAWENQ
jgi:hypothetical protein